eukprot:2944624-Alexandrium_andersonii.AAC.1
MQKTQHFAWPSGRTGVSASFRTFQWQSSWPLRTRQSPGTRIRTPSCAWPTPKPELKFGWRGARTGRTSPSARSFWMGPFGGEEPAKAFTKNLTQDFARGSIKLEDLKEERKKRVKAAGLSMSQRVQKKPAAQMPL